MNRFFCLAGVLVLAVVGCSKEGASKLDSYSKNGACSIDVPTKGASLPADQPFAIGGWAFDQVNATVPSVVTIYLANQSTGNAVTIDAQRGTKREDVAQAFENSLFVDAGFDASIEANKLTPGTYEIVVAQADEQAPPISCGGEHTISIK